MFRWKCLPLGVYQEALFSSARENMVHIMIYARSVENKARRNELIISHQFDDIYAIRFQ